MNVRKFLSVFFIAVFFCSIIGCSTTSSGRKINKKQVTQIQKGQTTKAEIERSFGSPESKNSTGEKERWTYGYSESSVGPGVGGTILSYLTLGFYTPISGEQKSEHLIVTFQNNIVQDFSHGESGSKSSGSSVDF